MSTATCSCSAKPCWAVPLGSLMKRPCDARRSRIWTAWASISLPWTPRCPGCRAASARQSLSPRSVYQKAKILLLDEPTAAMGAKESALILDLIPAAEGRGRYGHHDHCAQLCPDLRRLRQDQSHRRRSRRFRQAHLRDLRLGTDGSGGSRIPQRAQGRKAGPVVWPAISIHLTIYLDPAAMAIYVRYIVR